MIPRLAALPALLCLNLLLTPSSSAADSPPNILLIMADDLGYSDLGCYGSEIKTPNLDGLAANGLKFTQFYNTARCWPTRASLLTGYYAQQVRRDKLPGIKSGGGGKRPPWAKLLPFHLKSLGYRSYHSGKWHLDGMPLQTGFNHSYYLKDQGRFFNPQVHHEDDVKLPPVKKNSGYYSTTAVVDHAIKCLQKHAKEHSSKPFFQYLAFAAPHFPLHALPEDIKKYESTYTNGWTHIRTERWQRMKQMGLLQGGLSNVEEDLGPPYDFPKHLEILGNDEVNRPLPWKSLTANQQKFQATKMALHAAMIHRMDIEIGRVLQQIKTMGEWDNTVIMFLSDNGASAEIMVRSDGHDPTAPPGSAASYLCLGPGWSTVSNTPFRRHKTWTHEGGISTPFIVSWPRGIKESGSTRRQPAHVIDVVPTLLDITGGRFPNTIDNVPVPTPPGKSLLPTLKENHRIKQDPFWWFHDGHRALRKGSWKVVAAKDEPWELYNLKNDRAESNNLANRRPGKLKELTALWEQRLEEFIKLAKD